MLVRRSIATLALLVALFLAPSAYAASWLGATGDSLTEPYAEVAPATFNFFLQPAGPGWPFVGTPVTTGPTPMNWIDQIQTHRAAELTVDNYGLGGADSHTLLDQNQHSNAAAEAALQIGAGKLLQEPGPITTVCAPVLSRTLSALENSAMTSTR